MDLRGLCIYYSTCVSNDIKICLTQFISKFDNFLAFNNYTNKWVILLTQIGLQAMTDLMNSICHCNVVENEHAIEICTLHIYLIIQVSLVKKY